MCIRDRLEGLDLLVDPGFAWLRHVPRSAHVDGGDARFDAVHVDFRFEVLRQGADVYPLHIAQSPGVGRGFAKRDPAAHRQYGT